MFFYYESDSIPPGAFSRIHRLHDSSVPLHRSFKLSIKPDSLPDHLKPYAIIARVSEAGEYHPAGGYWEEDYLVTKSGSFGDFTVCIDSIPPSIQYTGNLKNEVLRAGNSITFTIEDDFSGIKSFRGTLDGKWILFDWDPKTSTLKHKTDKALLPRGTQKELILRVLDRLGNIAEFKKTVTR